MSELISLFFAGLLSGSILPGGSEALLIYQLQQASASPFALWLAASLGNTLGGMSGWLLGYLLVVRWPQWQQRHVSDNAARRLQRFGPWALLFSWLPLVGDPLTVAAGFLRFNPWLCLALIAVGKSARYGLLLAAGLWFD